MSKILKQNAALKTMLLSLVKVFLPVIFALVLTVGLTALAKMRWTTSLCASFFFVGLALLAKPLIEILWRETKTKKAAVKTSKRRFAER